MMAFEDVFFFFFFDFPFFFFNFPTVIFQLCFVVETKISFTKM